MSDALRYYSHQDITEADIQAVSDALRSQFVTQGPLVEAFEAELCEYVGAKYAVAVNNGTTALWMAYTAAGYDTLQTSPLSFMATSNAALLAGYSDLRFGDVDPATGNWPGGILADGRSVIVPVHFAGRACPIPDATFSPATKIIEDASQALGAMCFCGCGRVGNCAHSLAATFSFHAVKPICTAEGGAITTNDEGYAKELRSLRDHGREGGLMVRLGINGRMTEIQAALGISQLSRCDEMRERRIELAEQYDAALDRASLGDAVFVPLPIARPMRQTIPRKTMGPDIQAGAYHLYPIRIKNGRRDEVKAKLNARGIMAQVHYSPIIPLHPYYRQTYGYMEGDFPQAEAWAKEELSLPLHSKMTAEDVVTVVEALKEALA